MGFILRRFVFIFSSFFNNPLQEKCLILPPWFSLKKCSEKQGKLVTIMVFGIMILWGIAFRECKIVQYPYRQQYNPKPRAAKHEWTFIWRLQCSTKSIIHSDPLSSSLPHSSLPSICPITRSTVYPGDRDYTQTLNCRWCAGITVWLEGEEGQKDGQRNWELTEIRCGGKYAQKGLFVGRVHLRVNFSGNIQFNHCLLHAIRFFDWELVNFHGVLLTAAHHSHV